MGWVGSGHTEWTLGQLCFLLVFYSEVKPLLAAKSKSHNHKKKKKNNNNNNATKYPTSRSCNRRDTPKNL